jgi:hypothetical protein
MKIGRIGFASLFAVAISVTAASGVEPTPPNAPASIGVATMSSDGTIQLQLRAEGQGAIGDAVFFYKPGDPMYEKIKEHLGGIKPGEEKPVPPWPESP